MEEEKFHSAMESRGVIMELPRTPNAVDGNRLLNVLCVILG